MKDEIENSVKSEGIALDYFKRNPLLYVDMSECVLKGAAGIVYAEADGVLLYEKGSGIYMFAAEELSGARLILERERESVRALSGSFLVAHGENSRTAAYEFLKIKRETSCYQVVYTQKQPLTLRGTLDIRKPEREQIELIKHAYHLESPEHIEALCKAGDIFCGFVKGNREGLPYGGFAGFIGRHPEGSMGLLQIFPEYRRKGYGEELESFMINEFLKNGRVPYGHVIDDNEKSMNLQKKLGYATAKEKVYWLLNE